MIIEIEYTNGDLFVANVPDKAFENTAACLIDDDLVTVEKVGARYEYN